MPPLRNWHKAQISGEKLRAYVLNPKHPEGRHKARLFNELGYDQNNWRELRQAILDALKDAEAQQKKTDEHGERWEVRLRVTGPSGKAAMLITGWIYDRRSDGTLSEVPRLITAYIRERDGE